MGVGLKLVKESAPKSGTQCELFLNTSQKTDPSSCGCVEMVVGWAGPLARNFHNLKHSVIRCSSVVARLRLPYFIKKLSVI